MTRAPMLRLALLALALWLVPGCKDETKAGGAPASGSAAEKGKPAAADVPYAKQVSTSLEEAGLKPSAAFEQAAARPYEAKACARGEIDKLDVLVCDYDAEPAAEAGEKKLEQFVSGAVSGAIRRVGTRVLAVADRNKVDPTGAAINKVVKAFAGGK